MNSKQKYNSSPNLLKGILAAIVGLAIAVLATTWLIIDFHLEKLVEARTSEYAHSIARIAANSSAESLLSDDKMQLNLLVQNIAKDAYIRQATIISENGQIVAQSPEETTSDAPPVPAFTADIEGNRAVKKTQGEQTFNLQGSKKLRDLFMKRQKNKVYFEKISYQNITAGWFKLEIDKQHLEQNFREVFLDIQLIIFIVTSILFVIPFFIMLKFDKNIKKLVTICQQLLIQNKIKVPLKKSQWMKSIEELSQSHPQRLQEHINLPKKTDEWINSRLTGHTLICHLEFNIPALETPEIAETLTKAERYLNKSIQAFGVQAQGDILSGCLIPMQSSPSEKKLNSLKNNLTETIGFVYLIRQLLERLTPSISVKAIIMHAPVLFLEDEQGITTGLSLLEGSYDKIKKISLMTDLSDTVSLSIKPSELENLAHLSPITIDGVPSQYCFKLTQTSERVKQLISRKIKYFANK